MSRSQERHQRLLRLAANRPAREEDRERNRFSPNLSTDQMCSFDFFDFFDFFCMFV